MQPGLLLAGCSLLGLSSSSALPDFGLGGLPNIGPLEGIIEALPEFLQFGTNQQNEEKTDQGAAGSLFRQAEPGSRVCLTRGCVKAAAGLVETMDETADPCSDFYQFSCGGFIEKTVIPDHKTSVGAFSLVRDRLNERLRKLFEAKPDEKEPSVYSSVRNFYQSCMDKENIKKNSLVELQGLISQLGGWPVLQGAKWQQGDNWNWWTLSMKASELGYGTDRMISIGVGTDSADSTLRRLEVDQPSLGLSREYLIKGFEDKDVQAYYRYMVDIAVFLGAEQQVAEYQMKKALELELKLAEISLPREERRNKTALYNPMTIKEASEFYPSLPWVEYINVILDPERKVNVDENEIVNVAVPQYLKDFKDFIDDIEPRTIANYIVWRSIKYSVSYLGEEALKIRLKYQEAITGKSRESPRWEKCVASTAGLGSNYFYFYEGSLTNAVGGMYAKKYFQSNAKEVADEMVKNIREEFKIMLDEVTWMDTETKKRAHTKVDKMVPHIAYAKEILDDDLINEFYNGFILNPDSYLQNILAMNKWISTYYAKEFRSPIDKTSWKTHGGAAIVNAFYSPSENSISFPAGILDGVFFGADRPLYMNYGAIGMVVGHEITHGFDDQGAQKDGDGNLVDWWEPATKQNYLDKAQCIIDQYGNFTVEVDGETLNVNGINTQGENIADNGGGKEAYRAYNRLVEKYGPEPILPGLPYSQRQLYWLSTAQVWCSTKKPASLKNQVLTDPHSPTRFRVNGPFSNMPDFAADWGCPIGSPLNPVKKCNVW